ncbi:hypothetical protein SAMN05444157_3222 [Frankineae bacterium MT45]|nr:hypothetical protein SAMN05444157_3222 [Frankineae bacterium MT45]
MTDEKNDFAAKASDVAQQLKAKAEELAAAAAPAAEQAKGKASELAAAAAPKVNAASTSASHQVAPLAGRLKKLTGGRFDKHIDTVSTKLETTLDRSEKPDTDPGAPS